MRLPTRVLIGLGGVGLALLAALAWLIGNTAPPGLPVMIGLFVAVIGLAVIPWVALVARRLPAEPEAFRLLRRAGLITGGLAATGTTVGLLLRSESDRYPVVMLAILMAGVLGIVGGVILPWIFVLTRAVARERAGRVRAEERADVAAHLHDSVLQALTLIQKKSDDPDVLRIARRTERELRTWLYRPSDSPSDRPSDAPSDAEVADFAAALRALAADIEDQYATVVELVCVGTRALDESAKAVVGAVREALTNAAKHAGVRRVSVYAEAGESRDSPTGPGRTPDSTQILVLVRDRGRGFDPTTADVDGKASDRRGIADSITDRIRRNGGTASIRSAPGEGTEVEIRMPVPVRV
ncbi:ATP-binding protein [Streptomyces sp. CA-288835]|uniref:sensor histidine kinase n=1 Tax=Streptomyces sp. CA-288835 TaxID=3240069 RepID=UPI003D94CF54